MKIRSKLLVVFLIVTIFPIVITFLCITVILKQQTTAFEKEFCLSDHKIQSYELIRDPLTFYQMLTEYDYDTVLKTLNTSDTVTINKKICKNIEQHLVNAKTSLVVLYNETPYYIGNTRQFKELARTDTVSFSNSTGRLSADTASSQIIRECRFTFTDGAQGRALLLTDCSVTKNWIHHFFKQVCLAFLLIMLITTTFTTIWIQQSILRPIELLRLATAQIGLGNLEDPVPVTSQDEIGQLRKDLEQMRIHLKEIVNKGIQSEDNTREIMSSITHDLKTPITAIKGYTEGILDGVADTPDKQKKYLQTIYAKANDMTYLIDELSVYSKVEQNSLPYNFISVNLENYFTDCIDEFSLDLESQNFHLDYINDTDKNTQIIADPEQLKRVINNLISNAVKYSKNENGHITIHIKDVPVQNSKQPLYRQINEDGTDKFPTIRPEYIQIQIEDNGLGIAKKDLPHIFDRFFRADASRNSSKRGSGLGLAIVKMIISDHGGKVWVDSTEGIGSCFYFTLRKDTKNNGGAHEQDIDH